MKMKRIRFQRPKFWVVINSGVFMLSLYGTLTELPNFLGIVSLCALLLSSSIGVYGVSRSIGFDGTEMRFNDHAFDHDQW